MATILQHIVTIGYTFYTLNRAQDSCDFSPPEPEYNAFTSVTRLPFAGDPPYDDPAKYVGYKAQSAGVNDNGTIYLIGGLYKWSDSNGPIQWWSNINVYDSFMSYDDAIDMELNQTVFQSAWNFGNGNMPDIPLPAHCQSVYDPPYTGGFLCYSSQCSTYMDNKIYLIRPSVVSQSLGSVWRCSVMFVFDMTDSNPHYLHASNYTSVPPNNYWNAGADGNGTFDTLSLSGGGCTTHNNTHIFHFSWAGTTDSRYKYYYYPTTYSYHPPTDQWTLLSGNPNIKFRFTCAPDATGRYLYLLAGVVGDGDLAQMDPSFATDKYDTWTDSWIRLPSSADYPEKYGRQDALSALDRTTNSILVTSGAISYNPCGDGNCMIPAKKVEIFRLDTEDWFIPTDLKNELYFDEGNELSSMVVVHDFVPNGQVSNESADIIFLMGGGGGYKTGYINDIQFMTTLVEREYYPNNIVRIEGDHPDDKAIGSTAFDPWQRFELSFRIVITEGIEYEIDDSWNISFNIDGRAIDDINEAYDTQILTRPPCQCWGKKVVGAATNDKVWCENTADNVKQITIVELMIPSHRTLHNGYCVDREAPWIFSYENASNITVTATNGEHVHQRNFVFEFVKIELITKERAAQMSKEGVSHVIAGCQVMNESSGTLTHFAIRCDGFTCPKCPVSLGIGRDSKKGRARKWLRYEIEYNILMNDVLLAPGAFIRQEFEEKRVIGTESLNTDSLIAIVRARTAVGTWYQECFYNFSYGWTKEWQSLTSILNETTNEELWNDVILSLNSENNEDIIAAYSILQEMVIEDEVPDGEDPVTEINVALQNIMVRMDPMDENMTMNDITSNLALVDLLTSDADLVPADIVLNISSEFIPDLLDKALEILNDEEADYEPGVLADTVQNIGEIANSAATNLLNITNLTEVVRQELVDDVNQIMSTSLTGSWEDEVLLIARPGSKTKGYTIPKDEACELDDIVIEIPPHNAATTSDTVKCVVTETDEGEVAIDLFDGSGTRVFGTNDSCLPYFISMNVPDALVADGVFERALAGDWHNASLQFPKCTFWNRSEEEWSGKGCFVYEIDSDSVTCACSHLTTFKITAEHFDPKPDLLTAQDARQFTAENIEQHPTTWVTMMMIVAVLSLSCICVPNKNADRPLIAFEDIIYKEFRDQYLHKHQQWHEIEQINRWYGKIAQHQRELVQLQKSSDGVSFGDVVPPSPASISGSSSVDIAQSPTSPFTSASFEMQQKTKRSKYYCLLSVNLFKTYLKNDHTVLSVFQRTDGTNFSTKQRIGLFLLYMYLIMMADAIFYGGQYDRHSMGDLTASILISVFATFPVYLIRKLFQWSKPTVVKSAISWPLEQAPSDEEENRNRDGAHDWTATMMQLKQTRITDMKLIRKCMDYLNKKAQHSEKVILAHEIRSILFNYSFPFPHYCKKIAWAILIIVAVICILISVIYGIRFDIRADQMAIERENQQQLWSQMMNITNDTNVCWNMSMQLVAQKEVLSAQIVEIQEEQARIESLMKPNPDDFDALFGDITISDSTKWLLNVLVSFLASVFLWQPLSIYFVTWLKIWAFHNGFVMEFSYANLSMFVANYVCCCCICGGFSKRKKGIAVASSSVSQINRTELTTVKTTTAITATATPADTEMNTNDEATVTEMSVHSVTEFKLPSASNAPDLCTGLALDMLLDDESSFQAISFLCNDDFFLSVPEDAPAEWEHFDINV